MLHTLYRNATPLIAPFLKPYLSYRVKKGKEDPKRLNERFGRSDINRPNGNVIWIHAASVGESISALPLVKKLTEQPNTHVVLTTGTVTSAQMMSTRLPKNAIHQYAPLDHTKWIKRFLNHWQPSAVLWLESELWPNTLHIIKQRNIPSILVNARMSTRSLKRWAKHPKLANDILSCFDLILGQNQKMTDHIRDLDLNNTDYVGNLKFGSPPLTFDSDELQTLKSTIGNRPLWLVASTHEGEEGIAFDTHKNLRENHTNLLTILIPRHPKRAEEIIAQAKTYNLSVAQRSKGETINTQTDIYLADTLGEIGLFYKLCPIVTIAGSFIANKYGGHNIIEPAHLECAITYGPTMYNHQDSQQALESISGAIGVKNTDELAKTIDALLIDPKRVKLMQDNAKAYVTQNLSVIDAITNRVLDLIKSKTS